MVRYQGTKFHPRLGIDHQLVTPLEFLAMLIPHVALKYEVTMRCYGAISTTFRRRVGWLQHPPVDAPPRLALASTLNIPDLDPESIPSPPLSATPQVAPTDSPPSPENLPEDPEFLRRRKRGWAKLIAKTFKDDPGICKGCGQPMKIIAAIGPDQPEVIERILRHLHLWDPPWKRVRKARGPPHGPQSASPSGRFAARNAYGPSPRRATAARFPLGSGHFAARPLASQPPAKGSPPGPIQTIDQVMGDELYSVDEIPPDEGG